MIRKTEKKRVVDSYYGISLSIIITLVSLRYSSKVTFELQTQVLVRNCVRTPSRKRMYLHQYHLEHTLAVLQDFGECPIHSLILQAPSINSVLPART